MKVVLGIVMDKKNPSAGLSSHQNLKAFLLKYACDEKELVCHIMGTW